MQELLTLLLQPENLVALATLIALEVVLGIDNLIFIAILVGRLPPEQRQFARNVGLSLALITRLALLFTLAWIMGLTTPLFSIMEHEISGRDIILIAGGLFLLAKSTHEIHRAIDGTNTTEQSVKSAALSTVLLQIAVVDVIFSLDSVITAVGMVPHIEIMVVAVVVSVVIMLLAAKSVGEFVDRNPTIKMLALAFLILIGSALVAEGLDVHFPKAYIYFAMAFSLAVEILNMRTRKTAH